MSGAWELLPNELPLTPIHAALLSTGKVLFWSPDLKRLTEHSPGSPDAWPNINKIDHVSMAIFDPETHHSTSLQMTNPRNLFCAGHCFLPDGRLLVAGGHAYGGIQAKRGADHDIHVFDPADNTWSRQHDMLFARWYPTCTTLEDGRVLTVSGYFNGVPPNPTTWPIGPLVNPFSEIFKPPYDKSDIGSWLPRIDLVTLYPFVKLLPGGTLFVHNKNISHLFVRDGATDHPLGRTLSPHEYPNAGSTNFRTYPGQGACVVLPLDPTATKVRILVAGGGGESATKVVHDTPATATAEIFDFDTQRAQGLRQDGWRLTGSMRNRRFMSDAVLLPDGSVLVLGGSRIGKADDNDQPVRESELYYPQSETWKVGASQQVPRQYHSVAVLLPDGRVLSAGSTAAWPHPPWPIDDRHPHTIPERRVEIYSPPYLFDTGGHIADRPEILDAPASIRYGQSFTMQVRGWVHAAALLRPCSVTHSNNMDQRYVGLHVERLSDSQLSVVAPPDGSWAPPGYYMLFVLTSAWVPSVARFIRVG